MKRKPLKAHESLDKWISYLEENPEVQLSGGDMCRILRLLKNDGMNRDSSIQDAASGAAAALYVANHRGGR